VYFKFTLLRVPSLSARIPTSVNTAAIECIAVFSVFAICYRPSSVVCRLSVTCALIRRLKFSAIFLRHLVPWPSDDIHRKFYGDRPRETPPPGELNTRGVAISDLSKAIFRKQCKIGGKLVLITNRKSYMSFQLVPKSVTLNDLERRNGVISANSGSFRGRTA